jgi:hypothetical protein
MDGRKIFKLSPRSGNGGMDWIDLAQDTNRGRAVVNVVKKTGFH